MTSNLELEYPIIASLYAPLFFRVLGMISVLPLGERRVMSLGKIGTSILLTLCLVFFVPHPLAPLPAIRAIDAFLEFFCGLMLSIPLALFVGLASSLGEIFDSARGVTISSAFDPIMGISHSTFSEVCQKFLWSMLWVSGLAPSIIAALLGSVQGIPLGHVGSSVITWRGAEALLGLCAHLLYLLTLSTIPLVFLFGVIELALGILSRISSITQLSSESFTIKLLALIIALEQFTQSDLYTLLIDAAFSMVSPQILAPI